MQALTLRALRSVRRVLGVALIVSLLVLNVLTVLSSSVQASIYDVLSHVPIEGLLSDAPLTRQKQLAADNKVLRQNEAVRTRRLKQARAASDKIAKRTARNVTINVGSVASEAVPYIGAAVVVGVTAMDVYDGCNTVRDVNQIVSLLDVGGVEDQSEKICGIEVPTVDDVVASAKTGISDAKVKSADLTQRIIDRYHEWRNQNPAVSAPSIL